MPKKNIQITQAMIDAARECILPDAWVELALLHGLGAAGFNPVLRSGTPLIAVRPVPSSAPKSGRSSHADRPVPVPKRGKSGLGRA